MDAAGDDERVNDAVPDREPERSRPTQVSAPPKGFGKAVTLLDVAAHAGVSFKTVSRVVNGEPNVRPETTAKVLVAVDALQYRPNQVARNLRRRRSGFLALLVPHLNQPYFAALASWVSHAAKAYGRTLIIEETSADPEQEAEVLDALASRLVDGVIFSPLVTTRDVLRSRMMAMPIVTVGEHFEPEEGDHVAIDNVGAADAVTEHVLASGRRRIAVIGREPGEGTGGQRWAGVIRAHDRRGLTADPDLAVPVTYYGRAEGAEAMGHLLSRAPEIDAVICFSDLLAVGALRTLREHGVSVPGDVAVSGFDDIEETRFTAPRLTTVSPDIERLATEAVRLLVRRVENPQVPPQHVRVPFTLAIRGSTDAAQP
ncbi:LacI family DNA-binding transcriptional regulator [Actinotalea sp. K2]|uniref:LacI family DNA-binding transcriptional regulator n=1 Tax=Actinotalea sp. K2 TaxID=2939438 RepID=UPI0020173BAD|nr:LacI family DNA-binding transcriptional regulator [Actinotalea sp. K2]MCL3862130.1 LacI family transcriptional regulator [Actinotalea sp. K2]